MTFRKDLRRSVIFGRNDLVQDAPISRIDLLICRNTLMYFNAETQTRILRRFHFALNQRGYLFLGKAEMLITRADVFTPVELEAAGLPPRSRRPSLRDRLLGAADGDGGEPEASNLFHLREGSFDTGASRPDRGRPRRPAGARQPAGALALRHRPRRPGPAHP